MNRYPKMDDWGMTAEDHEVEQDEYLRSLSREWKEKENELSDALNGLIERANGNRILIITNNVFTLIGLIVTVFIVILLVYGQ